MEKRKYTIYEVLHEAVLVEPLLFSHLTPQQRIDHFNESDGYYTLGDLENAIDFAQKRLGEIG